MGTCLDVTGKEPTQAGEVYQLSVCNTTKKAGLMENMKKVSQNDVLCPRCGSAMFKSDGSTLYWHADSNHPPCSITNLFFTARVEHAAVASSAEEHGKQPA